MPDASSSDSAGVVDAKPNPEENLSADGVAFPAVPPGRYAFQRAVDAGRIAAALSMALATPAGARRTARLIKVARAAWEHCALAIGIEITDRLLAETPESVGLLAIRMEALADLGDDAGAAEAAEALLRIDPSHFKARRMLDRFDLDEDEAAAIGRSIASGPHPALARKAALVLLWSGRGREAVERLERAMSETDEPLRGDLALACGLVLEGMQDFEAAIAAYQLCGPGHPKRYQALLGLLNCHCERGDGEAARLAAAELEEIADPAGAFWPAWYQYLLSSGRIADALAVYTRRPHREDFLRLIPNALRREDRLKSRPCRHRILILPMWGPGDEIRFAALYPFVAARFKAVGARCEPRLRSLFERSFPEIAFTALRRSRPERRTGDYLARSATRSLDLAAFMDDQVVADASSFHLVVRIEDILHEFVPDLIARPTPAPHLRADPARVGYWRFWLQRLGRRPRIAVS